MVHRFGFATVFSLALFSLCASALTANAGGLAYCRADVARLCPGVEPGGGHIIHCLQAHKMEVSIGCGKAIQHIKAELGR
jgi:hypothetical protein